VLDVLQLRCVMMLQLEDDPHNTVAFHVIGEFLYGNTAEDVSFCLLLASLLILCPRLMLPFSDEDRNEVYELAIRRHLAADSQTNVMSLPVMGKSQIKSQV